MTKTNGAGVTEFQPETEPRLSAGVIQNTPIWIKHQHSASPTGDIIEWWQESRSAQDDADWLALARKARSRFADENSY